MYSIKTGNFSYLSRRVRDCIRTKQMYEYKMYDQNRQIFV